MIGNRRLIRHLLPGFVAIMAVSASSVSAQISSAEEWDVPVPVCGEFEYVEENGKIISRQIIENCKYRHEVIVESSNRSGIAVGGLALVGLAVAAGGSGGDGSGTDNPFGRVLHPRRSPAQPPAQPFNPASWRGAEFNRQYGLGLIGIEHRYASGSTGRNTLGAIYDTGIDLAHEDVGGIRLHLSHNYVGKRGDISDRHGHGTHVYGIAGATRNGTGIHGVAPDAQFMILKSSENFLAGSFSDALRRTIDAGADAMNNSWGVARVNGRIISPEELLTSELETQLRRSVQTGVSVVFATGNNEEGGLVESNVMARLPLALPELEGTWLAVTALDTASDLRSAGIASYANSCGTAMNWCLAAPGTNISSLRVGGGITEKSGTSMATPHVMGAVLVIKSRFPEMTTPEVHKILFDTAVDLGVRGIDSTYGHGALNFNEALAPQGTMTVELGETVDEITTSLASSWMTESSITGGVLGKALSDRDILVTDRYDRGYFANLGSRVATGSFDESPEVRTGLAAAFFRASESHPDLAESGFGLRFDAFGPGHDVTRVAHADPIMSLVSQTKGTGFSMEFPVGKTRLSMAQVVADDRGAFSLGAGLPFGDDHVVTVSFGQARETDSLLGTKAHGAFAGLNSETVYGRAQADLVFGERVTLNGSVTAGQTSFRGNGVITDGRMNAQSAALGVSIADALMSGDQLSLALARPFAVSGGEMTIRGGTGISAAKAGLRTNRVSYAETTVPLGKADRAPEVHLGYLHGFETRRWDSADLAFGGVARLDGGARVAAARIALNFGF